MVDNDANPTVVSANITRVNNLGVGNRIAEKAALLISDHGSNYPFTIQQDNNKVPIFTVAGNGNVNISGCYGTCSETGVNLTLINLESNPGYTRLMAYEDSSGFTLSGNIYPTPGSTSTSGIADYTGRGGVIIRGIAGAGTNSYIDFGISQSGSNPQTLTSVMRLTGTGRVGVGTTNPQQELEVVGDLNVTGTIYGAINTTGDVNCTECVDTTDIANSAVTSAKIANGAVTSSDLANPLGGSVNATAYYDSSNSAYFLDPANTGTSLQTAGVIRVPNNFGGIDFGDTDGNYGKTQIFTTTSNGLRIQHNSINPLINIDSAGNIGINSLGDSRTLYVNDRDSDATIVLNSSDSSYDPWLGFFTDSAQRFAIWRDRTTGYLNIVNGGFANSNKLMTITNSGNVGINQSSPESTLDVGGAIRQSASNPTTILYHGTNSQGTPDGDGFRIRYEDFYFGATGEDALIFEKTDGNTGNPDNGASGIAFVNTGNDGVVELAMAIKGNNRVGIATPNPSHTLVVNQTTAAGDAFRVRSGNFDVVDVTGSVTLRNYPSQGARVLLGTYNSGGSQRTAFNVTTPASGEPNVVLLPSGGNVGIGTNNVESRLHIQLGTSDFTSLPITDPTNDPGLVIEGSTSDDSSTPQIVLADEASGTSSNAAFIDFLTKDPSSSNYDRWVIGRRGYAASGGSTNRLVVGYTTSSNAHSAFNDPNMVFLDSGNVGIGTLFPNNTLTIVGSSAASVTTDSAEILRVQNSGSSTNAARLSIIGGNAGESAIRFGDTDSRSVGAIYYDHTTNNMSFYTNAAQRMVIDSSGRLGVGITNPSFLFEVAGDARLGKTDNRHYLKLSSSQWPEIRFETPSYNEVMRIGSAHADSASYGVSNGDIYAYSQTVDKMDLVVKRTGGVLLSPKGGGNVGINVTSAAMTLDVNGGIRISTTQGRPSCSSTIRGTMWFEQASDDIMYACMKNSTDAYNWVIVARGS